MPGSSIGSSRSFRFAACFMMFSRDRSAPHCLSTWIIVARGAEAVNSVGVDQVLRDMYLSMKAVHSLKPASSFQRASVGSLP